MRNLIGANWPYLLGRQRDHCNCVATEGHEFDGIPLPAWCTMTTVPISPACSPRSGISTAKTTLDSSSIITHSFQRIGGYQVGDALACFDEPDDPHLSWPTVRRRQGAFDDIAGPEECVLDRYDRIEPAASCRT
jgi:hypothetical protein